MARKTSRIVATSPVCQPLKDMYDRAIVQCPRRWTEVEEPFLRAMWEFDRALALGQAEPGENRNGKGDFFNDLIALLLENCSGKQLPGRGSVPGLIFRKHNLDTSYPATGTVEILIETKVAGAPKSPANPKQKNPRGRRGSQDLDKRIKEAGFKTIDLKLEWARHAGQGGGPTSDLISSLRASKPHCFLFLAVRTVDEGDLKRAVAHAEAANLLMDGVGLVAYEQSPVGDAYQVCNVSTGLELDRVLSRVCTALRVLP